MAAPRLLWPSVLAPASESRAAEPGVGDGHHLYPDGTGLYLSGRCHRLVQPEGSVMAGTVTQVEENER